MSNLFLLNIENHSYVCSLIIYIAYVLIFGKIGFTEHLVDMHIQLLI